MFVRARQTSRIARTRPAAAASVAARAAGFHSSPARRAEIELEVDGKKVSIEQGSSLIQACEKAGKLCLKLCYCLAGRRGLARASLGAHDLRRFPFALGTLVNKCELTRKAYRCHDPEVLLS